MSRNRAIQPTRANIGYRLRLLIDPRANGSGQAPKPLATLKEAEQLVDALHDGDGWQFRLCWNLPRISPVVTDFLQSRWQALEKLEFQSPEAEVTFLAEFRRVAEKWEQATGEACRHVREMLDKFRRFAQQQGMPTTNDFGWLDDLPGEQLAELWEQMTPEEKAALSLESV